MNSNIIYEVAVWLIPLVIAIVFHEVAHGLVARGLGDPTAQERGRLTLNPVKHIDPFGTVILPLLLAISHAPVFGWAKPVPVNYARLRHPRRDMVLVALAGPGMNLLLALLGAIALSATLSFSSDPNSPATVFLARNAFNFVFINIFLGIFNLLPVPPFDGGHVVEGLASRAARDPLPPNRTLFAAGADDLAARAAGDLAERERGRAPRLAPRRPHRHWSAGDLRHRGVRCSTAGSFSTSRSGSARPRR